LELIKELVDLYLLAFMCTVMLGSMLLWSGLELCSLTSIEIHFFFNLLCLLVPYPIGLFYGFIECIRTKY